MGGGRQLRRTGDTAALDREFAVPPNRPVAYRFPAEFDAYWVQLVADRDTTATGTLRYD